MRFSPAALQQFLPPVSQGVWWVALSGGLDSCVLLNALVALQLPVRLRAIHINHRISPNAYSWQEHCATFCAELNVPFTAFAVDVLNLGTGLEDAARRARYEVFEKVVQPGDTLLTAHHADDQAETLLLRLMRGSGPRGLAGMAHSRSLVGATLHRPLLKFTRDDLAIYAAAENLAWINDESNTDDHYDRNFLRNQVMPLLRERWPQFTQKWQQAAELCLRSDMLADELAMQDLHLTDWADEFVGSSIDLQAVKELSLTRRHNLLRHWLLAQKLDLPQLQHLAQIDRQVFMSARQDAEIRIEWGNVSMRVFRRRLFALPIDQLPQIPHEPVELIPAEDGMCVELPKTVLTLERCKASSTRLLKADLPNLSIRFRRGGERCRPVGRAHSQTLKRLLQEYGVVPWLRDVLPLIYSNSELVAVADLWVCEGYQVQISDRNTQGFLLGYSSLNN